MADSESGIDLTLVASAYNEQDNVEPFYEAAVSAADAAGKSLEIVFVDDGSADATGRRLREVVERAGREGRAVRVVSFSRNFGKEAAMYAGLGQASGRHCCFIDADLQQRPETAFAMLAELEENPGFDCVAAVQENRRQSRVRAWFSRRFYGAFSSSSGLDVVDGASDFRVFTRPVADALLRMPEYFRFSKGLFAWVGFKTLPFAYTPDERLSGTTTWSFSSLVRYAAEGVISFSTFPLRIATLCGGLCAFAALVYAVVVAIQRIAFGVEVPGYATIVILVLLIGGVQLLVLGVMGEYLARAYIQGKHRPVYIVRETLSSMPADGVAHVPPAASGAEMRETAPSRLAGEN